MVELNEFQKNNLEEFLSQMLCDACDFVDNDKKCSKCVIYTALKNNLFKGLE